MSAEQIRETLQEYVEVLLSRGDYGRFFDDDIEFALMGTDQQSRGAEAVFVGTHTGDFSGVSATGNRVRVPYSVFYDVDADKITALRIYMPMDQLLAQIGGATEPEVARAKR